MSVVRRSASRVVALGVFAFVTSTVAAVIEWAHAKLPRTAGSALLAVVFGVLFASTFHVGLHLALGTPELWRTVAVPIAASFVYAGGYLATLRAAERRRSTDDGARA